MSQISKQECGGYDTHIFEFKSKVDLHTAKSDFIYLKFRESVDGNKLWFVDKDSTEILVMDLSLQVGDTLKIDIKLGLGAQAVITKIETVGLGRIKQTTNIPLSINGESYFLCFEEGVGPNFLMLRDKRNNMALTTAGPLLCTKRDLVEMYKSLVPKDQNCSVHKYLFPK